ncbi:MAG: YfhO family protein [Anaerolineae bacterium]
MTPLSRLRQLSPYFLLVAALALFFWPVWLLGYTFPVGGGDLWGQLYPVWSYVGKFVRRGVFPLWSTHMMAGDPIVGEPQYGLFNPLNWWLFVASPMPRWAILARGLLPLFVAGAGMYTYLRHSPVWRLSEAPSLVGATAYMLADPFLTHLGHPQINDAMAWLPWCFLAVDVVVRRRRFTALAVAPIALTMVTGHYQTTLFTGVATGLYALWRLLSQPPGRWLRLGAQLLLVALCGVALAMPAILPSLERYPYTERAILQVEAWRGYQWPAAMAIDLLAPGFHGRGTTGFWAPWARVEGGYTGAAAFLLALLALLHDARRPRTWFFVLLGGLAVGYALGHDGPIYPTLYGIDLIARMHKTARAIYLLSFCVAVGAAAGAAALRCPGRRAHLLWIALLTLGGVLLLWQAPRLASGVPADVQPVSLASLRIVAGVTLITAALGRLGRRPKSWVQTALLLLLLGELVLTGTGVELEPTSDEPPNPAIAYLKSDPNWFRVDVDGGARGRLSPAVLLSHGFEVPQGSGNPMELFSYTQFYWAIPYKGAPAYQLLGVKYIIVPSDAQSGGENIWPVFTDAPLVDVHLNTNAMTRVWLVYDTVSVATVEEANDFVFAEDFRPAEIAVVQDGPTLNGQGTGTLEVLAYAPNKVEFFVRTSEEALLILSDMHYPGWIATVDRKPTPIHRTDVIFRGVVVPSGEHRVTMRYRPRSLMLGLGLASVAALILVTNWVLSRRRITMERHPDKA